MCVVCVKHDQQKLHPDCLLQTVPAEQRRTLYSVIINLSLFSQSFLFSPDARLAVKYRLSHTYTHTHILRQTPSYSWRWCWLSAAKCGSISSSCNDGSAEEGWCGERLCYASWMQKYKLHKIRARHCDLKGQLIISKMTKKRKNLSTLSGLLRDGGKSPWDNSCVLCVIRSDNNTVCGDSSSFWNL